MSKPIITSKLDIKVQHSATLRHLPELDSLRAFAVIMTLLAHYSPVEIPYMWYGVPIFFTISGFLITTILLRSLNNNIGRSKIKIVKNFMVRRVLRLFPIYYLFVIIFWIAKNYFNLLLWKDEFTPYFFSYTPNFIIYKIGLENASCFAHFWSLGVEEQFYLFWPWVVLFSSVAFRKPIFIGMIIFSLSFIAWKYLDNRINVLPFKNFHTLGMGALLACFFVENGKAILWLKQKRLLLFALTLFNLIVALILFKESSRFWHVYRDLSLCICTFCIVLVSIYGWSGLVGYITRNNAVQYIGTISYGIYLFHMPVPYLYKAVFSKLFTNLNIPAYPFVILCFATTFLLAGFSYKYIETPFLKMKKFFA
jgi:peptidoglycan/LPS O-acetylase OafA/YrhL